nr:hypothetical protein [Neorhizobium tomejilense]
MNEPDYTGLLETWETLAENAEHPMGRQYEPWELELIKSNQANITVYEDFLRSIDDGERIVIPDVGDVTEQERKKAEWFLAYHKANLLKLREGAANDNEPPMDEELADLIAGDW